MKEKIIVVGGGLVGCSAAYYLGKQGFEVTLLEKEEIAYGASGRNPGYILIHPRQSGEALEFAKAGLDLYKEIVEELGNCFEFRQNGCLNYFYTEDQKKVMEEFCEERRKNGVSIHVISKEEARDLAPILPENILGATYCPLDAQIRTPLLVKRFAELAKELYNVNIVTGVEVEKLLKEDGKVHGVETSKGAYFADVVVLATGAWSSLLDEPFDVTLPVYPERLQVFETEPIAERIKPIVYGPTAMRHYSMVKDCPSFKEEYFESPQEKQYGIDSVELVCQTEEGSLLVGCAVDYPGLTSQNPTIDGIQMMMGNFHSQFAHLNPIQVRKVWAGWLPFTTDGLPIIDEVEDHPGLIVGVGHIFGNATAPLTGKIIMEMIAGLPLSYDISQFKYKRMHPSLEAAVW